jgi:hypothetical protein
VGPPHVAVRVGDETIQAHLIEHEQVSHVLNLIKGGPFMDVTLCNSVTP